MPLPVWQGALGHPSLCATRAKRSFCLCSPFPVPLGCLFLTDSQDAALRPGWLAPVSAASRLPAWAPTPGPCLPAAAQAVLAGQPRSVERPAGSNKRPGPRAAGTVVSKSKSRAHHPAGHVPVWGLSDKRREAGPRQDGGSQARTSWEVLSFGDVCQVPPASARLTAVTAAPTPATGHWAPLLRSAGSQPQTGNLLRFYSLCYLHGDPMEALQVL